MRCSGDLGLKSSATILIKTALQIVVLMGHGREHGGQKWVGVLSVSVAAEALCYEKMPNLELTPTLMKPSLFKTK